MSSKQPRFYEFTVEGSGDFPVDMLRYDACWPFNGRDASEIQQRAYAEPQPKRRVVLQSCSSSLPTAARWQSFSWRVVGVGVMREAA